MTHLNVKTALQHKQGKYHNTYFKVIQPQVTSLRFHDKWRHSFFSGRASLEVRQTLPGCFSWHLVGKQDREAGTRERARVSGDRAAPVGAPQEKMTAPLELSVTDLFHRRVGSTQEAAPDGSCPLCSPAQDVVLPDWSCWIPRMLNSCTHSIRAHSCSHGVAVSSGVWRTTSMMGEGLFPGHRCE